VQLLWSSLEVASDHFQWLGNTTRFSFQLKCLENLESGTAWHCCFERLRLWIRVRKCCCMLAQVGSFLGHLELGGVGWELVVTGWEFSELSQRLLPP
jgi:hypothetical protein